MKVAVKPLLAAIAAIDLVPSRAGISSSEFIKLQANPKRLAFTLACEIFGTTYTKVEEPDAAPWTFWVDRASFIPFVMAAKELGQKAPFEFIYSGKKEKQLTVKCGHRKAVFQTVTEISGYEDKANLVGAELVLTHVQRLTLGLASKYATSDPTIAHLNCVYLQKHKSVLACNDLAAFHMADSAVPMSLPLPILLLSVLGSDQVVSVEVSPKFAKANLKCGYLCQLTNRKAAEEFPFQRIVSGIVDARSYKRRFTIKATSLMTVLSRLELYISGVVKRDMMVSVSGKRGDTRLKLVASVPQGRFEESVGTVFPLKADVECNWLLGLLLPLAEVAKELGNVTVRWDSTSSFYFKTSGLELLLSRKI